MSSDYPLQIWNEFCKKQNISEIGVILFVGAESVSTLEIGKDRKRLILKRSIEMNQLVISEVEKVLEDYRNDTKIYDGLIFRCIGKIKIRFFRYILQKSIYFNKLIFMKKAKNYRKELQFEINGISTERLNKIDEDVLRNEFGIYKQSDNCFTMGRAFGYHEHQGEGLPTGKDNSSHHKEFNLNFDIRISHDGKGNVEFLVAEKAWGRISNFL